MQWFKAFHIIFMVTWFAGLFYLPRLFVYHAQSSDTISHDRFVIMERKLFAIMTIGAILTLLFGFILLFNLDKIPLWLQLKLALIAALIVFHLYCLKIMRTFKNQDNCHSHVYFRWINEVPVLFLIAIVLLAVTRFV